MTEWNDITPITAVGQVVERIPYEECPNCGEYQVTRQEQRVRPDSFYVSGLWVDWLKSLLWSYSHRPREEDEYVVIRSDERCTNCHWEP